MGWWGIELLSDYREGLTTLVHCGVGCGWTCSVSCWVQDIGGVRQLLVRECRCVGGPFVTRPRKLGCTSGIVGELWISPLRRETLAGSRTDIRLAAGSDSFGALREGSGWT